MTWVKIDDLLTEHRKVIGLSDRSFRVYIAVLCFCSRNLTDGRVTARELQHIGIREKERRELCDCGLWKSDGHGGVIVHDYLKYQPSRAKVQARREAITERVNRHRDKHCNTVSDLDSDPDCNGVSITREITNVTPPPSRPVSDPDLPPDSDPVLSSPDPDPPENSGSLRARASGGSRKKPVTGYPENFDTAVKPRVLERAASERSWPAWWVENRLEKMRETYLAKGLVYADWGRTAFAFLLREVEEFGNGPEQLKHLAPPVDLAKRQAEKAANEARLREQTRRELGPELFPEDEAQSLVRKVIAGAGGGPGASS